MRHWKSILLAVLATLAVLFGVYRWWASDRLQAVQDRVRAAGFPVTYPELDEYYALPASGENRAYLLQFAIESIVMPSREIDNNLPISGSAEVPHRSEPIPEKQVAALHTFTLQNEDAVEAVFESFEYDECRFPIDLNAGMAVQLDHLAKLRMLARRLSARSLYSVLNAEAEEASRMIDGIVELADSLDNEPLLISQLVRIGIQAIGLEALEQAMNRIEFSENQLRSLQERLIEAEANRAFVNGYIGERCSWTMVEATDFGDRAFGANGGIDLQDLWVSLVYRPSGLMDLDGIQFHDAYDRFVEACALPIQEQIDASKAIRERIARSTRPGSFTSILLPGVAGSMETDIQNRAHLRIAIVALAAARYRAEHGAFPDNANVLVPDYLDAVPIDPSGGAPFRYRILDRGFVVYSLGRNGTDENGEEVENRHGWKDGDLTFTVESPA